ncbi:helix-turn-helix domain-containing protein [Aureimonas psammosilenae]|uniref:helix-turn-helix domain-containing protein n=1 Tax=Aureimonas psammosilenae TaxID=2495496 RepID=UPI00126088FD|nr:helix-turn-helix domain-containing protein [Aureimonas psammosilenae]
MSIQENRTKQELVPVGRPMTFMTREREALLCAIARHIASAAFDVALCEIERPDRAARETAAARQAAMYVAHVVFQVAPTSVGREFGRDRTSVGHAVRLVEDRRDDRAFDERLDRLESTAISCLSLLRPKDDR